MSTVERFLPSLVMGLVLIGAYYAIFNSLPGWRDILVGAGIWVLFGMLLKPRL